MTTQRTMLSAGGIITHGNDVLLVNENGTFWGFPKGQLDRNETIEQAATREIIEETGLHDFTLVRNLGSYQRYPLTNDNQIDTSHVKQITLFLFHANTKDLRTPTEPNITCAWIPRQDVAQLLTHPMDRDFYVSIEEALT